MARIGRKIYYDKLTGDILVNTGERSGNVVETTVEEDIATFKALSERNIDTFDYIQLEYGQYSQDFIECNGYRVNTVTKQLEFSYLDPNIPPEEQEIIYQRPLSEQVTELETRTSDLEVMLAEILFS